MTREIFCIKCERHEINSFFVSSLTCCLQQNKMRSESLKVHLLRQNWLTCENYFKTGNRKDIWNTDLSLCQPGSFVSRSSQNEIISRVSWGSDDDVLICVWRTATMHHHFSTSIMYTWISGLRQWSPADESSWWSPGSSSSCLQICIAL